MRIIWSDQLDAIQIADFPLFRVDQIIRHVINLYFCQLLLLRLLLDFLNLFYI